MQRPPSSGTPLTLRQLTVVAEHKLMLQTNGATDWEFFTIGDEVFLAVANAYNYGPQNYLDVDNYATNSTIYRLNQSKRVFEKYQSIPTYR